MELKDFISTTLVEIQEGVQDAIQRCAERGLAGAINPGWSEPGTGQAPPIRESQIQEVRFDIAVTVNDKSAGTVGGGIKVVGLSFGADSVESAETSHVSRIQFSVPVVPPVTKVEREWVGGPGPVRGRRSVV